MQIILKSPGQLVRDFALNGSVVTVAGHSVDVAARQLDVALLVEIRRDGETVGEIGTGAYLAQIEIPARQFIEVEVDDEEAAPAEEGQEPQPPKMERQALPLDTNAVSIVLWPAT